jgi:hypothetical protein
MPHSFRHADSAGQTRVWLLDPGERQLGEFATPSISAYPNEEDVCLSSLSEVLETGVVPRRYFLSRKACEGILRRAERQGKTLPPYLAEALRAVGSEPTSTATED